MRIDFEARQGHAVRGLLVLAIAVQLLGCRARSEGEAAPDAGACVTASGTVQFDDTAATRACSFRPAASFACSSSAGAGGS